MPKAEEVNLKTSWVRTENEKVKQFGSLIIQHPCDSKIPSNQNS